MKTREKREIKSNWGLRPTAPGRRSIQRACIGAVIASACFAPGCAAKFDTDRDLPKRGSVGEEIYGVVCDRVGAQAIPEDLSGASFHTLCHKGADGKFADKVDDKQLPVIEQVGVGPNGEEISIEAQKANRKKAIGRVESLARRRPDLVFALDSAFPETKVQVKDLSNEDETKSCGKPKDKAALERKLTDELTDLLGRMGGMYEDGTMSNSTQSLGRVVDAFRQNPQAQAAWSRMSGREGYRPVDTAVGAIRPILSYPRLRELSNASLRLLSADSRPLALDAKRDADGNRIPEPGPGNAALNSLLDAGRYELASAKAEPPQAPMVIRLDASADRSVLSRPRDNVELANAVLLATDPGFGSGAGHFIVKRDKRGYAMLAGDTVVAPFIDANGDGFADTDAVGHFLSVDGKPIPSPFPFARSANAPDTGNIGDRDQYGRPLNGGKPMYEYIDIDHTFAAQLARDMGELAQPTYPDKRETLMDLARGLRVVTGDRVTKTKKYDTGEITYQAVKTDDSPLLDLVYAGSVVLGDKNSDLLLATVKKLWVEHPNELARAVQALLTAADSVKKYSDVKLPPGSTFWDEMIDVMAETAKEDHLLEDVLAALADPASAGVGPALATYAKNRDEISYNPADLNGDPLNLTTGNASPAVTPVDRSQPITGKNRSILNRFLQLVSDGSGVTLCNKPNATLEAYTGDTLFQSTTFEHECDLFKISDVSKFYVDVIGEAWRYDPVTTTAKRGSLFIRDPQLGALATYDIFQDSTKINGFIHPVPAEFVIAGSLEPLLPVPKWLNRVVFFDATKADPLNERTQKFIAAVNGTSSGTALCKERTIPDPHPEAADASPDKMVHGLRTCGPGETLNERDGNTLFALEQGGFFAAVKPLVSAFVKHGREDLFIRMSKTILKHYPSKTSPDADCKMPDGMCARDGLVDFEPALAEVLGGDVVPALTDLLVATKSMTVTRCDATQNNTQSCSNPVQVSGTDLLATATRSLLDPDYAKNVLHLTDRHGNATSKRSDGSTNPQATPATLLLNAFSAFDASFDKWEAANPDDKGERREALKIARSDLLDKFFATTGRGRDAQFANAGIRAMVPNLVDVMRSQLFAHCPNSFSPPYEPCTWAIKDLPGRAEELLGGPLTSAGLDMVDVVANDAESRKEITALLSYMLDPSQSANTASLLATGIDIMQLLSDDNNVVPMLHFAASTMAASKVDSAGKVTEKSFIDAQMSLLSRVSARRYDENGAELCSRETDPNGILGVVLKNLVTPLKDDKAHLQSPLEILVDVILDVNRADPSLPYDGGLAISDYGTVGANVTDFLTNKEHGLEQLYEIIRQGTKAAE